MSGKERIARDAAMAALRLRTRTGRTLDLPICPFDLAEEIGVTVHFEALASLEGMYSPDGPTIVVGALRPPGRRSFTCAHELGHHELGHGLSVDELVASSEAAGGERDLKEFAADRFASALLMPKLAVSRAFSARGWDPASCTAEQVYVIAGCLGVGYTTLIGYLERTLHLLPSRTARDLERVRLPVIRARLLGEEPAGGVVVVDVDWIGRPVDVTQGDLLVLPATATLSGPAIEAHSRSSSAVVARAVSPGVGLAIAGGWSVKVRVTRSEYRGLAVYRHLEHDDDV